MSALKSTIKKLVVANQTKKYKTELKSKNMDYSAWVEALESSEKPIFSKFEQKVQILKNDFWRDENDGRKKLNDGELAENDKLCKLITINASANNNEYNAQYLVSGVENLPKIVEKLQKKELLIDAVILKKFDGKLSFNSIQKISFEFFTKNQLILIYGDEDVVVEDGSRHNPWYKPDWSPDDFLSYFYFGGLVAISAKSLLEVKYSEDDNLYSYLYKLLLFNRCFDKRITGIDENAGDKNTVDKNIGCIEEKVCHISSILFHSYEPGYDLIKDEKLSNPIRENYNNELISIIIPSKDHPEILFRCIDSLIEKTKLDSRLNYEIIVVDNGSNDKNKMTISDLLEKYGAKYIYEKREFNFSYMCNLGATNAKGNYLSFLNDDMEIIEADWLQKLFEKAHLPYAGAVGAKLLYPNSDTIQHCGITNLRIGPAHKLQFLTDSEDHYFGRNRMVHDMLAVTGACLLVKKSVFDEVSGFDENLAVAFNDVDLCYKIYEKGYYNIERCDVRLYHHESLSRGNDAESSDKQLRLNKEKDYLYERHQSLYGTDPFYNINLTTDMWEYEYAPKYHYEVKLDREWAKVYKITDDIKNAKEDKCVRVGMECAMDIFKWKYGVTKEKCAILPTSEDLGYYFQGYTFVIGANNACFERQLFIKNTDTEEYYGIPVSTEYRQDIAGNIPDQLNVDLAGYTAKITADAVPSGHYQFGMYMKDKTSSLRLYNMSNWTIDI